MLSADAKAASLAIDSTGWKPVPHLGGWPTSFGGGGADETPLMSGDVARPNLRYSIIGSPRSGGPGPPAREGRGAVRPARLFVPVDCSAHSPCVLAAASGNPLRRTVQAPNTCGHAWRLSLRASQSPRPPSIIRGGEGLASLLSDRECSAPAGGWDENGSQRRCLKNR